MIPFNFHHLYYFYTIAKASSMSEAASELKVSQPALSAQLKRFESYFEMKLFHREGRKLRLTEDGEYLFSYAESIFNMGRELVDGLQDRAHKGRMRMQVGISDLVPKALAASFIRMIQRIRPDIYLNVREDEVGGLLEPLHLHALDLVLNDSPAPATPHEDMESILAGSWPVVFCARPALARKCRRFPKDLDRAPVILPTAQSGIYQSVRSFFAEHRITPKIIAEIQDVELVYRLALSGVGIAPLNRRMVSQQEGNLVILDRGTKNTIRDNIYLILRKRKRPHPVVEEILKAIRAGEAL